MPATDRLRVAWQPVEQYQGPSVLALAAVVALCGYASLTIAWPPLGHQGERLVIILGLFALLRYGGSVRRDAALWFLVASLVLQSVSWFAGLMHHPQWVEPRPDLGRLAGLFIFVAIAWWLGGSTRNTLTVWSLAAAGLFVSLFTQGGGFGELWQGLQGVRVDFGIRNAQHPALLFGTVLIGLAVLWRRCWQKDGRYRYWRVAVWFAATALALVVVIITQTRGVWLGLMVGFSATGAIWLWNQVASGGIALSWRRGVVAAVIAAVVAAAGFSRLEGIVEQRLSQESAVVSQIEDGTEGLPAVVDESSSIAIRINSWAAALDWIAERPLLGWGGHTARFVIREDASLPDSVRYRYKHMHNSFIEILLQYGLSGFALFGGLAAWAGRESWRAWRAGVLPGDLYLFSLGFFFYWLTVNLFESYVNFWTGVFVYNLILGGLCTHFWRRRYWMPAGSTGVRR